MEKRKVKKNKVDLLNLSSMISVGLMHVLLIFTLLISYQYFGLEISIFLSLVSIIITFILIVDVIFLYGIKLKNKILKVVSLVVSTLLSIIYIIAIAYIMQLNAAVDEIIDNSGVEQFETISGDFVTFDNSNILTSEDLEDKKVGVIFSTVESFTSIGQEVLTDKGIEIEVVEYVNIEETLFALFNGEIEAAILPGGYESILKNNDVYASDLEKFTTIETFSKDVKVGENESANLDLATEPFNVLIIGYAPEGSGGLADTIMVASVNPQTLTASLVSIPRDSYVPVICFGNKNDKINHARSNSRQCLMDTAAQLLDTEIDFYIEANFDGVVEIVDAVGGIIIDSPVEFVGQTSSTERGEYTVWVDQGVQRVNGEQALAFARERYAMPNGDFDRVVHQQEVIVAIMNELVYSADINKALGVLEAAGDNVSTNLSISQLTSLFNSIITKSNFTGIDMQRLVDVKSSRLVGYSSNGYDYYGQNVLWVYPLFDGSIAENKAIINSVLGTNEEFEQAGYFKFFREYPYTRGPLYSEWFNEVQEHEELPPIVINLVGKNESEVRAWASANGVNLVVDYVSEGEPGYNANSIGVVSTQSHRYGLLLSGVDTLTVTISGAADPNSLVPNFVGRPESEVKTWAKNNGYTVSVTYIKKTDANYNAELSGSVATQSVAANTPKDQQNKISITVYELATVALTQDQLNTLHALVGKTKADAQAWATANGIINVIFTEDATSTKPAGQIISYIFANNDGSSQATLSSVYSFTISKGTSGTTTPTPPAETPPPTETPPAPTCTGGKVDDGSGNCVCPDGKVDNGSGVCEVPTPPAPTCTGGKEDDGSGNCVCPDGQVDNGSGVCEVPAP